MTVTPSNIRNEEAHLLERKLFLNDVRQMPIDTSDVDMDELFALRPDPAPMPRRGTIIKALVRSVQRKGAVLELGNKTDLLVPGQEIGSSLKPGDYAEVLILGDSDEQLIGSRLVVEQREYVQRAQDDHTVLNVTVASVARKEGRLAGLKVKWHRLSGFIPASQLGQEIAQLDAADLPGLKLDVHVHEADAESWRLIFSHRSVVRARQQAEAQKRMAMLQPGALLDAKVTGIGLTADGHEYGVFVDVGGGCTGLVHRTEIPDGEELLCDRFPVGSSVHVSVLKVEERGDKRLLSLSIKQPLQQSALQALALGDTVTGTVGRVMHYGVFVTLDGDAALSGLVHVSQMPKGATFKSGDQVTAKVIVLDRENNKIGLSCR